MLDSFTDTVFDMSFQNHLAGFMQCRFRCIDLCKYVLAWYILIDHSVDCLYLTNNFL